MAEGDKLTGAGSGPHNTGSQVGPKVFDKPKEDELVYMPLPEAPTGVLEVKPKRYDWDDVDLGIITIGVICILVVLLTTVYLFVNKEANVGVLVGVIASGITAIATLAGRRIKNNGSGEEVK